MAVTNETKTSNCTLLKCKWMSWEDQEKTIKMAAAVNFVGAICFLEIPVFTYLVTYGLLVGLVAGGAMKFSGKLSQVEDLSFSGLTGMQEDCAACAGKMAFTALSSSFEAAKPLLFWEDVATSAGALVSLYFASSIFSIVAPVTLIVFLFNVLLAYGKFHNEVDAFMAPHVEKLKLALVDLKKKIPTHKQA